MCGTFSLSFHHLASQGVTNNYPTGMLSKTGVWLIGRCKERILGTVIRNLQIESRGKRGSCSLTWDDIYY